LVWKTPSRVLIGCSPEKAVSTPSPDASILLEHGVDELVAITAEGTPVEKALHDGPAALARATAGTCRRIRLPELRK
jgi:hypothetical protein